MLVLNKYVEVEELKDNMIKDGIMTKYDDNSPYIYARIINGDKEVLESFNKLENDMKEPKRHTIVLTRRISKIPVNEHYFVHVNDLIALYTETEYKSFLGK